MFSIPKNCVFISMPEEDLRSEQNNGALDRSSDFGKSEWIN